MVTVVSSVHNYDWQGACLIRSGVGHDNEGLLKKTLLSLRGRRVCHPAPRVLSQLLSHWLVLHVSEWAGGYFFFLHNTQSWVFSAFLSLSSERPLYAGIHNQMFKESSFARSACPVNSLYTDFFSSSKLTASDCSACIFKILLIYHLEGLRSLYTSIQPLLWWGWHQKSAFMLSLKDGNSNLKSRGGFRPCWHEVHIIFDSLTEGSVSLWSAFSFIISHHENAAE